MIYRSECITKTHALVLGRLAVATPPSNGRMETMLGVPGAAGDDNLAFEAGSKNLENSTKDTWPESSWDETTRWHNSQFVMQTTVFVPINSFKQLRSDVFRNRHAQNALNDDIKFL